MHCCNLVAHGVLVLYLQISGVKVYGGPDRLVFFREASTGLSKLAYFWALDTWSYVGGYAHIRTAFLIFAAVSVARYSALSSCV
jgi:hypothetical protein